MNWINQICIASVVLSCSAFSETTILQGFVTSFFISEGGGIVSIPTKIISSSVAINENPLPVGTISRADYENRFYSINAIESTMITDTYYRYDLNGNLIEQGPVKRPFINKIDKFALVNLTDFMWDGSGSGSIWEGISSGYTIPTATGTFNQTEQKFYVSDGRQYQVVPEPSALSLLAVGFGGWALLRRRRS